MKGMVFTEFLAMVEEQYSYDVADRIIEASDLSTDGAYTSVGTYDHSEMVQLVTALSEETGQSMADLMRAFGAFMFGRFHALYGEFFAEAQSMFAFLESVESYIHVEVRKLYPEAELPSFECVIHDASRMTMTYRSKRPFGDLAYGLIAGCAKHFDEDIEILHEDLSAGNGTDVRFPERWTK